MRKVIIWGSGVYGREALNFFGIENVICFVDNNRNVINTYVEGVLVIAPDMLVDYLDNASLIIAVKEMYYIQIKYQLMEKYKVERCLNYEFVRKYVGDRSNVNNFLNDLNIEMEYRLMWMYSEKKEKENIEKFDFLIRHTDIDSLKPTRGCLRKHQKN